MIQWKEKSTHRVVNKEAVLSNFIDFKALKERVSIEDAANILKLDLKRSSNQLRGRCPACGNDDERILAITPGRNLFYCFDAKVGGDCIALVQHITGLDVQDAAAYLSPKEEAHGSPSRQKTEAKKETVFDPAAFASKLSFTDEVSALGLTEEEATRLGIGTTRGKLYLALRDEFGFTAGFVAFADGALKMPPKFLPNPSVVKLKRA
jgi:DNA primase